MSARKNAWGMTPDSQLKAQKKYDKANTVQFSMKLNTRTDEDIIKWLWTKSSKQGSIKELIREDIRRNSL